jgi:peptidoglycan hydrolase-like protein with peptidoglycan-binding domain
MAKGQDFTKWLQREFNKRGANLKVTGVNDAATQRAIGEFQSALGLQATGTATKETVNAYLKLAKGRSLSSLSPNRQMTGMGAIPLPPVDLQGVMTGGSGMGASINLGQMSMRDMSGPGGSPMSPPMQPTQQQADQYWQGDISQPPPWAGRGVAGADISSGNSPLAGGMQSYSPPNDPMMPPTQQLPSSISQGQFDQRFGQPPAMSQGQFDGRFGAALPPAQATALPPGLMEQLMMLLGNVRAGVGLPR